MFLKKTRWVLSLAATLTLTTGSTAQEAVVATQPATLWRFIGIPQGIQKIRDVSVNRRGNFPGLERKPPLTRIADPANLASDNPAIKAAAEIKKAEDMKAQKIKAIKYLASIGCGCYDKDGKITDALLAATDDCTPEVRLASIEAVESAIDGGGCNKCGSTSCCNEKISKRLSEMAYEKDDSGCPIEPSAEIRAAAKRVLCKCCPGRVSPQTIEEDFEVNEEALPAPVVEKKTEETKIKGESSSEDERLKGETSDDGDDNEPKSTAPAKPTAPTKPGVDELEKDFLEPAAAEDLDLTFAPLIIHDFDYGISAPVKVIGGMTVEPVKISVTSFSE